MKSHVKRQHSDSNIQQEIGDREAAMQLLKQVKPFKQDESILRREIIVCISEFTREMFRIVQSYLELFPEMLE